MKKMNDFARIADMTLRLDYCTFEAAKYAVMHWHYSHRMPVSKVVKIGVWEDGEFIGCVLFARGNTPTLGTRFGLNILEVCELVRVALTVHKSPVSRVVSIAIKLLKKNSPGLRLIISYADPNEKHHGGIYQAGNWVYVGKSAPLIQYLYKGKWVHNKTMTGNYRKTTVDYSRLPKRVNDPKYKYAYPLDDKMRKQIEILSKPYPKRAGSINGDAISIQEIDDGSTPISAL